MRPASGSPPSRPFLTLLIAYPVAYGMAQAPNTIRPTLLMLVILPFWTSFLIRVYAWIAILKPEGLLNQLLLTLGVIDQPLIILNTNWAIYIGIVYSYLPFMVLPIYSSLEKMDHSLTEAAQDLGCTPIRAFWRVTFPLSMPGVVAGCMLVFIPAVGEFVIPDLLGGSETLMIGKTLWNEFNAKPRLAGLRSRGDHSAAHPGGADHVLPACPVQKPIARGDSHAALVPFQYRLDRHRFRLSLSADRASGDLLLQRIQAGDCLGGLFDQMVCAAVPEPGASRCRLGHDPRRSDFGNGRDGSWHDGSACHDALHPLSRPHAVFPG